ncbi:transposase domain-containing protein [Gigaspora margarita]|uniref:Transposase domain-containing protein n=1 Tax=Gigaspora margarita TaxID=4874 RepID=A0A8H4A0B9_GIGMA|nr:transposase domain-containing protein [Gigaspora margarita]
MCKYLLGWIDFVNTVQLCTQYELTANNVSKIWQLLLKFYNHYEREYYKKKPERLPAIVISFHYLLHVADSISNYGPCWSFWQFPMECLCGMLLLLIHSKIHPYSNLANNVLLIEQFNYLPFIQFYKYICKNEKPIKQ